MSLFPILIQLDFKNICLYIYFFVFFSVNLNSILDTWFLGILETWMLLFSFLIQLDSEKIGPYICFFAFFLI